MAARRNQHTLILGLFITAGGLICLASGIALLIWQIANPEQAARLPQSIIITAEPTPTPGILGTELAPPPLPDDPIQIAILPVSEDPTATPEATHQRITPTPTRTQVSFPPPRPTETADGVNTQPAATQTPSETPEIVQVTPTVAIVATSVPAPSITLQPPRTSLIPDRIIVDRIALNVKVVPVGQHAITLGDQLYSQWDVPSQRAAGWHQNSGTLGVPGNVVLNGHHNVSGEVFRYLRVLEPGDLVTLESSGQQFRYIVVQTMTLAEQEQPVEVRRENARWILPTADERVTLITCWPYTSSTHRLVVIARPVKDVIPPANIP